MFEVWFGSLIFEGLLFLPTPVWQWRRVTASLLLVATIVSTVWLCIQLGLALGLVFGFLAVFRCFNLLRVIKNRMHEQYLRQAAQHTSHRLIFLHLVLVTGLLILFALPDAFYRHGLPVVQLIVSFGILLTTVLNIKKLAFRMPEAFLTDRELPTVTVAIPARNETTDLMECLHSVLANNYPKLEVIVLDDSSQKKTADIIRDFAHDGVRFIKGQQIADRWLAKNQAYQQLAQEASGDVILFCGVDVRLGPQAIRSMVNLLHHRNKAMLSVLPLRTQGVAANALIQPMRYWWELALPRRLFNHPPVLSTCWVIDRDVLKNLGGFGAVSHTILPEGYFARELVKTDGYSFIRSSNELEVHTTKSFIEQRDTAVRTLYPRLRRRPENVLLLSLLTISLLLGPFIVLLAGFWTNGSLVLPLLSCLCLIATHVTIMSVTDPANTLLGTISLPLAILADLVLEYVSMIRYEFFAVEWKGRNISLSIMHVIPQEQFLANELRKA